MAENVDSSINVSGHPAVDESFVVITDASIHGCPTPSSGGRGADGCQPSLVLSLTDYAVEDESLDVDTGSFAVVDTSVKLEMQCLSDSVSSSFVIVQDSSSDAIASGTKSGNNWCGNSECLENKVQAPDDKLSGAVDGVIAGSDERCYESPSQGDGIADSSKWTEKPHPADKPPHLPPQIRIPTADGDASQTVATASSKAGYIPPASFSDVHQRRLTRHLMQTLVYVTMLKTMPVRLLHATMIIVSKGLLVWHGQLL